MGGLGCLLSNSEGESSSVRTAFVSWAASFLLALSLFLYFDTGLGEGGSGTSVADSDRFSGWAGLENAQKIFEQI